MWRCSDSRGRAGCVILDECANLRLKVAGKVVVVQEDTVFHGLVPALNLALGLWMEWRAADVLHFLAFQPLRQIARDIARAVITEQARFVTHNAWPQPDAVRASLIVSVTSSALMFVQSFPPLIVCFANDCRAAGR